MKSYCKYWNMDAKMPYGKKLRSLYQITKEARDRKMLIPANQYVEPTQLLTDTKMVFRLGPCPRRYLTCCGICTYRCDARCLQDIATRLHYLSVDTTVAESVRSSATNLLNAEMTDEAHYQMVSLIDIIFCGPKARRENKQFGKFDYAASLQKYQDEQGRNRIKVDAKTGIVLIHDWPDSGFCPHCLPAANRKGYTRTV